VGRVARPRTAEQQLAFPFIPGHRCRPLELAARLVETTQLLEEISARARQQMVAS
jgi:hypothetical protein